MGDLVRGLPEEVEAHGVLMPEDVQIISRTCPLQSFGDELLEDGLRRQIA